jgi:hypothetical protein
MVMAAWQAGEKRLQHDNGVAAYQASMKMKMLAAVSMSVNQLTSKPAISDGRETAAGGGVWRNQPAAWQTEPNGRGAPSGVIGRQRRVKAAWRNGWQAAKWRVGRNENRKANQRQ